MKLPCEGLFANYRPIGRSINPNCIQNPSISDPIFPLHTRIPGVCAAIIMIFGIHSHRLHLPSFALCARRCARTHTHTQQKHQKCLIFHVFTCIFRVHKRCTIAAHLSIFLSFSSPLLRSILPICGATRSSNSSSSSPSSASRAGWLSFSTLRYQRSMARRITANRSSQ